MSTITLTKAETAILTAAAEHADGLVVLAERMKPASRERVLGRFLRDGLASEQDGAHSIAPAGYKALGLKPPRRTKAAASPGSTAEPGAARAGTKLALVREMLGRPDGATLAELVAATGWLPHTTRAVLSRLRSAGQPLAKSPRPDGSLAYRIEASAPAAPAPAPARRTRRKPTAFAQAVA